MLSGVVGVACAADAGYVLEGDDASISAPFTIAGAEPTRELCEEHGITGVHLLAIADGLLRAVPGQNVRCWDGPIDSRPARVLAAGTHELFLEADQVGGTTRGPLYRIIAAPSAHVVLPVTDLALSFETPLDGGIGD